jgi:hypothetical protein
MKVQLGRLNFKLKFIVFLVHADILGTQTNERNALLTLNLTLAENFLNSNSQILLWGPVM